MNDSNFKVLKWSVTVLILAFIVFAVMFYRLGGLDVIMN